MDQIRRDFLWARAECTQRGIALMCWDSLCLPKELGGLGIPNLELRNIALLMRWWWKAYEEPDTLWAMITTTLKWIGRYVNGPNYWAVRGSFFWNQLISIKHLFHWSTIYIIGDGSSISFWYESWCGMPLLQLLGDQQRPTQPLTSLRDAAPIMSFLLSTETTPEQPLLLENEHDILIWRWESTGIYSVRSMYRAMCTGGKVSWGFQEIWSCRATPTVRIFSFLLLHVRILTHDLMRHRGMHCEEPGCVMCQNCPSESILHLFFLCPFAVEVWYSLSAKWRFQMISPLTSVRSIWVNSRERAKCTGKISIREWATGFCCACWHL